MQRGLPFVGHMPGGAITHDPASGAANLAAPRATSHLDEPTVFGTPLSELCREEVWKYEHNPLDVWDQLLAHSAADQAPDAEHTFRFKFHGLFYVAPAQDSFMLRLRTPGGVLTTHQLRGLADLAERLGSGRCDLTTRANLQIREFAPRSIVEVLNTVQRLGMSSRGTGADNIRNITASPLSGLSAEGLIDVQPFADALQSYISNSRDMFGLPRKFNVAFDDGGLISVLADTNDIGFVAVRVGEGKSVPPGVYFRVLLCGITGHRQFASDSGLLLRPDQAVAAAAAMVRVFYENGDRTDRKKARLKYLLDRWGVERFLAETEKKLAFPVIRFPLEECEPRGPIDRAGHLGVHPQAQPGMHSVGVAVPVGRLPVTQMRALADIADRWGSGELRLTVWQNLILPNVPTAHLDDVTNALLAAGLDYRAGRVLSGTVACTGSQGCRFAATDTKSHAVALAATLDKLAIIDQPINLHVTGCHNSCAQHYIGDIGMMGVKTAGEEGYQVNLGGGADSDQGIARELFPAVRWTQVEPLLSGLVTTYGRTRQPRESFLAFTRRHSIEELRGMCPQELQEQPTI
jgi:ferredoxin-nitrite reductase